MIKERIVAFVTVIFVLVLILSAGVAVADAHCAATPPMSDDVAAEADAPLEIVDPADDDTDAVIVTDGDAAPPADVAPDGARPST